MFYGCYFNSKEGFQFDGGVEQDKKCKIRWIWVFHIHSMQYKVPKVIVGNQLMKILVSDFRGVSQLNCNLNRLIFFIEVVMSNSKEFKNYKDLLFLLDKRLEIWYKGLYDTLVDDTEANYW